MSTDDCCPGEPGYGDPHGMHTLDCPVYLASMRALEVRRVAARPFASGGIVRPSGESPSATQALDAVSAELTSARTELRHLREHQEIRARKLREKQAEIDRLGLELTKQRMANQTLLTAAAEARIDADVARDQLAHCRCPDIDKETSMTGPEHYLEAERLLRPRTVQSIPSGRESQAPPTTDMILQAQVHATLALAAATALAAFDGSGMHADDFRAWDQTCGVNPGPAAFVQGVKAGESDA